MFGKWVKFLQGTHPPTLEDLFFYLHPFKIWCYFLSDHPGRTPSTQPRTDMIYTTYYFGKYMYCQYFTMIFSWFPNCGWHDCSSTKNCSCIARSAEIFYISCPISCKNCQKYPKSESKSTLVLSDFSQDFYRTPIYPLWWCPDQKYLPPPILYLFMNCFVTSFGWAGGGGGGDGGRGGGGV